MNIKVRGYEEKDLSAMIRIWNEVVGDGVAFPQEEVLTTETGREFFAAQTYSAVAEDVETGEIYGLYILHPNNVGRCGHICNASYAVSRGSRGLHCEFPYKSRVMPTSEPLKTLKAPYMARNTMKWGFFRLKSQ